MQRVLAIAGVSLALGIGSQSFGKPAKPAIRFAAEPFDLNEVRLLDGPFKRAFDLDAAYLRSLPPDRLLRNFRVTAGLPTAAEPLGGWEEPNCEVRGHFVGHYLTACATAVRATGDPILKRNADAVVAGMAECQARFASGYLSAFPESFFDRLDRLQPVWVPWYTLHKVYQGLLDMHTLTGNKQAMVVLKKACQWAIERTDRLSDEQLQKVLNTEHGGINEVFANIYAVSGDNRYLKLSARFNHRAVLEPLARGEDRLSGLHANTQFPKVIGAARQYELTGDKALRGAAEFFWNVVTRERSYVIGGNSDGEAFSRKEQLSKHIGSSSTETCNTYNMLRLTRHIFSWNARGEEADYYERALYNHILASQHPTSGMMSYYVPLKTGCAKSDKTPFGFSEPFTSFWCCTGTGVENHVKYGDNIYWREGDRALFVNLFIASELDWRTKQVRIRQTTGFPDEQATTLTFTCRRPTRLALHIRRPVWAGNRYSVTVGGRPAETTSRHPGFVTIERTWRTGDAVRVSLPMTVWTEGFRDDPRKVAFLYGPIVLCGETDRGNVHAYLLSEAAAAASLLKPVAGQPLTFTAPGDVFRRGFGGDEAPVSFRPFFRQPERAVAVYWDSVDDATWKRMSEENRQEQARLRELDARTVDMVRIGDPVSESEHGLKGEKTGDGPLGDRHWRHSVDGGWFSYDMKLSDAGPHEVMVTLWGSDAGPRTFDVLADGVTLGTITLANNAPGRFYDKSYPLPEDLVLGKTKVTVKFQARPGNFAGGVFGLRIVRASR